MLIFIVEKGFYIAVKTAWAKDFIAHCDETLTGIGFQNIPCFDRSLCLFPKFCQILGPCGLQRINSQ